MSAHILMFALYSILCVAFGYLGKDRKFGFIGNFFVSFVMTPLVGLVVLIAQNPKPPVQN